MPSTKSLTISEDESPNLEARIVKAIGTAGPRNVARISRMTGVHQETIRYKIKKRFGRLGFRFHADVDFGKIGLALHWAALDFTSTYCERAPQILRTLNQVGYLTYHAKLVPQGNHFALFALPQGTADRYRGFLSRLTDQGILDAFTLDEVLVSKHRAMDPRFFNFRSGKWEIEWNELANQPPTPLPPGSRQHPADFDYYDLLIIKELQKNSLQHLTGIARKLKVHQKTLEYHYRTHVRKWKLIPSYRIRWAQDNAKRPIHSVAAARLRFTNLSKFEFVKTQTAISKIPFLWQEDLLRSGTYIALMHIPVTDLVNVSSYISISVPNLASKVEMGFVSLAEATSFTIPYNMYQDHGWKFDTQHMETALKKEAAIPMQK